MGIIITLLAIELLLQFASIISSEIDILLSKEIEINDEMEDERLGVRPLPGFPGHDSKGYRNKSVPSQADIVILGDSQTYGYDVEQRDIWPQKLEKLTRKNTYNMAFGALGRFII